MDFLQDDEGLSKSLHVQFDKLIQKIEELGELHNDIYSSNEINEVKKLLGELYCAVDIYMEMLQNNQLETGVFYLEVPETLDHTNEIYAEQLEQEIAKYGVDGVLERLHRLTSLEK